MLEEYEKRFAKKAVNVTNASGAFICVLAEGFGHRHRITWVGLCRRIQWASVTLRSDLDSLERLDAGTVIFEKTDLY